MATAPRFTVSAMTASSDEGSGTASPVLCKPFEVKSQCLGGHIPRFIQRGAGGDAVRKIGEGDAEVAIVETAVG